MARLLSIVPGRDAQACKGETFDSGHFEWGKRALAFAFLWACSLIGGGFLSSCTYHQGSSSSDNDEMWKREITHEVKILGAKNWIVVGEPSFAALSGPATKTIITDQPLDKVLLYVLETLEETAHTEPRLKIPLEFYYVEDDYAPGVKNLRAKLSRILTGREPLEVQNNSLQQMLLTAAKDYNVLIIKTTTATPFADVYIELDAGYWNSDSQTHLRHVLEQNPPPAHKR